MSVYFGVGGEEGERQPTATVDPSAVSALIPSASEGESGSWEILLTLLVFYIQPACAFGCVCVCVKIHCRNITLHCARAKLKSLNYKAFLL